MTDFVPAPETELGTIELECQFCTEAYAVPPGAQFTGCVCPACHMVRKAMAGGEIDALLAGDGAVSQRAALISAVDAYRRRRRLRRCREQWPDAPTSRVEERANAGAMGEDVGAVLREFDLRRAAL